MYRAPRGFSRTGNFASRRATLGRAGISLPGDEGTSDCAGRNCRRASIVRGCLGEGQAGRLRCFPSAFEGRGQCGGDQTNVCRAHHARARGFPIDLDRAGKAGARLRLYCRPSGNRSPATERDSIVRNFRLPPNRTIWALSRRSAFGLFREIPLESAFPKERGRGRGRGSGRAREL